MSEYFSEELIAQAKETSLTQLAEYYGYHPRHVGNRLYTLAEHDSVRIIMTEHGIAGQGREMEKRAEDHKLIF